MNLLSPLALAFGLGVLAKVIRSELALPKDLYVSISIYLLFAIGIKGGVELSESTFSTLAWPAAATLILGCITPITSYLALRKLGNFSVSDSAGIAAHYGSVSAVTFIAAQQFVTALGSPAEGFMPTLLTLLESPGIHIALAMGAVLTANRAVVVPTAGGGAMIAGGGPEFTAPSEIGGRPTLEVLHEVLTGRSMVLLVGGLLMGCVMGARGYEPVKPFFEGGFKGALTLLLLELGLVAGERIGDLRKVGPFLLLFGICMPIAHGALGVLLGHWAGLSVGGCTVLGTMAASASYIAAPPAVRMTLPEANPTLYLTSSLVITFPFNLLVGIPLYYKMARLAAGA
ncbi:MAG: sodium-dependent bicarbonate transport family permease [Isosphaeraceae bacterium]